jgi:hypothetical protein
MRFRNLRIAFSATCLLACVLLIVLWVRSYWHRQFIFSVNKSALYTGVGSDSGIVQFSRQTLTNEEYSGSRSWSYNSVSNRLLYGDTFRWSTSKAGLLVRAPHWSLILLSAGFATLPWLRWQFTLRTLLIATTLVGVVLGIIVWMSQAG